MSNDLLNFQITRRNVALNTHEFTMQHKKNGEICLHFLTDSAVSADGVPGLIESVFKDWVRLYSEKTRKPLSRRQRNYYNKLVAFCKEEGRRPSYEEQKDLLGVKSKGTAYYFMNRMIDLGWCWRDEHGNCTPVDIALPE